MLTVVVAGDLMLDYHLVQHRENPAYNATYLKNPVLSTKDGGAWYLEDMIRLSCRDIHDLKVSGPQRIVGSADKQSSWINESYSIWSPHNRITGDKKQQVWRIKRFLGYQSPPAGGQPVSSVDDVASPDVLVLDDLGGDFRHKKILWPRALQEGGSPKKIVIKAHAPLVKGFLWEKLLNDFADQLTVVTSVVALRAHPRRAAISKSLSWDKTIEDVVRELERGTFAHDLGHCRRVIIHFDNAGAAIFTRCPLKLDAASTDCPTTPSESGTPLLTRVRLERFIYHPEELEGTWKSRFPGDSFGASTIMTAAVVRHELRHDNYPIIISVKRALMAIEANHEIGGGGESFSADASNKRIGQILHSQDENDKAVLTTLAPYQAAFPHALLSHPVMKVQPASASDLLQDLTGVGYEYVAELATEIVRRGWDGPLAVAPKANYGSYMTVDRDEIERINEVRQMIANYRNNLEHCEPLAIAVFGPPGSGKTFAITELAKELFKTKSSLIDRLVLKFNLTQIGEMDQLHDKLHQVRTATVLGEVPIVFWDEFDTAKLVWLKYFLAPLQDGVFETSSGSYPLGKAIFIFAGGTCHNFKEFNKVRSGQEEAEFRDAKGPDFVSRLQGFIDIKGPNPVKADAAKHSSSDGDSAQQRDEESSRHVDVAHLIRRAILLRSAIKRFKPNAIDEVTNEPAISPGLVRAFLRVKTYKHGARSLEAVVKMSTLNNGYLFSDGLPPKPLLDLLYRKTSWS
jgi:hypothetical protein